MVLWVNRVIRIGLWSKVNLSMVFHERCLVMVSDAVVMSGEVGFWFAAVGIRVGVSVFSSMRLEFARKSAIVWPLWSEVDEL